uniref:Calponin-homology (CH) domain-containing protein n=1 Tax=Xiphophorus couchianus TaxID=32473 RepID=A0A3B5N208_9TELE
GEKRKLIQPTSLKDPKLENLKQALVDWINKTLKAEHIVIQSLEEDLYDGLVLHHLLARLGNVKLDVEEISLTSSSQLRKLEAIMKELDKMLGVEDSCPIKWDVKLIHNKDLLATIHLLVAMAKAFQPELNLPPNVKIDVVTVEVSLFSPRPPTNTFFLCLTNPGEDPIEQLLKLEANKVNTVKKAILHFVNQNMATLGLQVADMDKQFADGVILLLLIGQLEGFFIPLVDFHLTPCRRSHTASTWPGCLHNVCPLNIVTDIVSQDVAATLRVLYTLFRKHKRN